MPLSYISLATWYASVVSNQQSQYSAVNTMEIILDPLLPFPTDSWLLLLLIMNLLSSACLEKILWLPCTYAYIIFLTHICAINCITKIMSLLFLKDWKLDSPDNYHMVKNKTLSTALSKCS